MSKVKTPTWLKPHLFGNRAYSQLFPSEIAELRHKLKFFKAEAPDVSVVIPAFNEENSIFRTLSSLADNRTDLKVEIIVVNNNSTDHTQAVLDSLGVRSYYQPLQGIAYARQMGLQQARGRHHLCADADSLYPPDWIELMTGPMRHNPIVVGVYGRYSILPPKGSSRLGLWFYEKLTGLLFRIRQVNKEHINVLGFNMGFITELGRKLNGFEVSAVRKFNNTENSTDYTEISEDGQMAFQLKTVGKLRMVTDPRARVYTSARKLLQDGGIASAFTKRIKMHGRNLMHYCFPSKFEAFYSRRKTA
ncbi:MAG: glycosyltransferase family 2 protein [Adhaeribacter sp.]